MHCTDPYILNAPLGPVLEETVQAVTDPAIISETSGDYINSAFVFNDTFPFLMKRVLFRNLYLCFNKAQESFK